MDGGRAQGQGMKEKLEELGSTLLCLISPLSCHVAQKVRMLGAAGSGWSRERGDCRDGFEFLSLKKQIRNIKRCFKKDVLLDQPDLVVPG